MKATGRSRLFAAITATWLAACGIACVGLWRYKLSAGEQATAPASWPHDLSLARAPDELTIVMVAHPKCPCTRASIDELAWLMGRLGDRAAAHVLVVRPAGAPVGWERDEIWKRAAAIPGVMVVADVGGEMAERFGARTSGDTLLYSATGELLFHGGITAARGHAGDNAGRARLLALAIGERTASHDAQVFGCALGVGDP